MVNVFLSWSGERSKAMAEFLSSWLRQVIQLTRPWMSDNDIVKGKRWSNEIGSNLEKHRVGIICVTPENYEASWLLFEAGALSKAIGDAKVCPLLLGMSPSELVGPLSQFQATVLRKEDVYKLVKALNMELGNLRLEEKYLADAFEKNWPEFEAKIADIAKIKIPGLCAQLSSVIKSFAKYGLPEPEMGGQACFSSGFESHGLYSTLTDVAQERLLIFGRKNRKLFDKEHHDFFGQLEERVSSGFDFRVLFLDPNAPSHIIKTAHQDDDLQQQIEACRDRAMEVLLRSGLSPDEHIRQYDFHRTMTCLVADDAVVYSPVTLDEYGRARKLTKAPFGVLGSTTEFGKELVDSFETAWSKAKQIT